MFPVGKSEKEKKRDGGNKKTNRDAEKLNKRGWAAERTCSVELLIQIKKISIIMK